MSEADKTVHVQIADEVKTLRERLAEMQAYLTSLQSGRLVGREQSAASLPSGDVLEIFDIVERMVCRLSKVIEQGRQKVRKRSEQQN